MFRSYKELYVQSASKTSQDVINESDARYNCEMCDEGGWSSETELELHCYYMHSTELCNILNDKTKIVCMTCATVQPDRETLYKHIKEDHLLSSESAKQVEHEIYICDYCHHIFFNKRLLTIHIQHKHGLKYFTDMECPKCFKLINSALIYTHFEMHQLQTVSLCPICLRKCKNRRDLKLHVKTHKKYFYCDYCQYRANNEDNYKTHMDGHKLMRIGYKGDYARYYAPMRGVLKKKFQMRFKTLKGLALWNNVQICVLCREICTTQQRMKSHILKHTSQVIAPPVVKKKHICSCGLEFFNNVLLKQHIFKSQGIHKAANGDEPKTMQEVMAIVDSFH